MYAFFNLVGASQRVIDRINSIYVPARVQKKVMAKAIMTPGNNSPQIYSVVSGDAKLNQYTEYKIINNPLFTIENQITLIDDDKVLICNFKPDELNGVIIHSKSYYQTMYALFQYIWNQN